MKSKNMTLMVVAIGCGLVAAFLTAKLSSNSGPEMVEVLVAKKEITVGTILEEKEFANLVAKTKLPKGSISEDQITKEEDLKGKRVNRTLRQGNTFSQADVSKEIAIPIPEGMVQTAIRTDVARAAGGSVDAGKRVDIVLTESQNNLKKTSTIMYDMLILQVDQNQRPTEGPAGGRQQVGNVSLAVTDAQARVLALAEARGTLTLNLRDKASAPYKQVASPPPGPLTRIPGHDEDKTDNNQPEKKKVVVVYAKTDVPVNTQVTDKNFDEFFRTQEVVEDEAPVKSIKEPKELHGKFVVKSLESDQVVFNTAISDKALVIEEKTKPEVADGTPKEAKPEELFVNPRELVIEPPAYPRKFEQIINNQRVWFLETAPGQFRKLETESPDLKNVPTTTGATEEKKNDKKPEIAGERAV